MNKYRVIITEPNGKELFNKVYEVPPVPCEVIIYLIEDQDFLYDLQKSNVDINNPNLKWEIYFESPLEIEQDEIIKHIRSEFVHNYFDTKRLMKTIYELLDDVGLHYNPTDTIPDEIKESILNYIQGGL